MSTTVKTGWLLKGPDSGKDNVMIFSRVNDMFFAIASSFLCVYLDRIRIVILVLFNGILLLGLVVV